MFKGLYEVVSGVRAHRDHVFNSVVTLRASANGDTKVSYRIRGIDLNGMYRAIENNLRQSSDRDPQAQYLHIVYDGIRLLADRNVERANLADALSRHIQSRVRGL